jgi:hypothetical protein
MRSFLFSLALLTAIIFAWSVEFSDFRKESVELNKLHKVFEGVHTEMTLGQFRKAIENTLISDFDFFEIKFHSQVGEPTFGSDDFSGNRIFCFSAKNRKTGFYVKIQGDFHSEELKDFLGSTVGSNDSSVYNNGMVGIREQRPRLSHDEMAELRIKNYELFWR